MSISRHGLATAGIWVAVAFLSVGVAEGAYRLLDVRPPGLLDGVYEPFGDRSFRLRPGVGVLNDWVSGKFWVYSDELGFRSGIPDAERGPADTSQRDVLWLGDSQGFGHGVDYESSVAGVLDQRLRGDERRLRNLAIGGHFLNNQVEVLEWLLAEHVSEPEAIFVATTPRMLGMGASYKRVYIENGRMWEGRPSRVTRARAWLAGNSAVYLVLRNALASEGPAEAGSALDLYARDTFQLRLTELEPAADRVRAAGARSGAALVVVYLPLAFDLDVDAYVRESGESAERYSSSVPRRLARAFADEIGATFVDARPALEALEDGQVSLRGDAHYNVNASQRVADYIYSQLSEATDASR